VIPTTPFQGCLLSSAVLAMNNLSASSEVFISIAMKGDGTYRKWDGLGVVRDS